MLVSVVACSWFFLAIFLAFQKQIILRFQTFLQNDLQFKHLIRNSYSGIVLAIIGGWHPGFNSNMVKKTKA